MLETVRPHRIRPVAVRRDPLQRVITQPRPRGDLGCQHALRCSIPRRSMRCEPDRDRSRPFGVNPRIVQKALDALESGALRQLPIADEHRLLQLRVSGFSPLTSGYRGI